MTEVPLARSARRLQYIKRDREKQLRYFSNMSRLSSLQHLRVKKRDFIELNIIWYAFMHLYSPRDTLLFIYSVQFATVPTRERVLIVLSRNSIAVQ